jgi:hypothetical protein
VTVKGLDAPDAVKEPGVDVTVYEVIGSLLEGAVKVTAAAPLLWALEVPTFVAVPIVGATGELFAPEALAPRIGIRLFYLTLFLLTVGLADI